MKITKSTLKQIIKEEVIKLLTENEDQQYATKILEFLDHEDPDYFAQGVALYSAVKDDIKANAPKENGEILEKLEVIDRFARSDIPDVGFLSGLSELNVTGTIVLKWCRSLENVDALKGLTSLMTLSLEGCYSLENVNGLKECTNLTSLNLRGCKSLMNIDGLKDCTNLTTLNLSWCRSLENVDGLKECTNLTSLNLNVCTSLQNVDGLQGLTNLTTLDLQGCSSLENVDGLQGLTNLTSLHLGWCRSLPLGLQKLFESDNSSTAHEKFMKALNASKGNQP